MVALLLRNWWTTVWITLFETIENSDICRYGKAEVWARQMKIPYYTAELPDGFCATSCKFVANIYFKYFELLCGSWKIYNYDELSINN